jgi:hypothetical protein
MVLSNVMSARVAAVHARDNAPLQNRQTLRLSPRRFAKGFGRFHL